MQKRDDNEFLSKHFNNDSFVIFWRLGGEPFKVKKEDFSHVTFTVESSAQPHKGHQYMKWEILKKIQKDFFSWRRVEQNEKLFS